MKRTNVVSFGLELSDKLVQALVDDGYREVRNAKELTAVLKEQNLLDKGVIDEDTSVKIGHIMGARYMVNASFIGFKQSAVKAKAPFGVNIPGSYEGADAQVKVAVSLLDLESGKTEFAIEAIGEKKDKSVKVDTQSAAGGAFKGLEMTEDKWFNTEMGEASELAVKNAAREIVLHLNNISVATYVPKEDVVIINKGDADGIKVGDKYEILRVKQTKENGEVIFEENISVGSGEVVGINGAHSKLKVDWTWSAADKKEKDLKLIAKPQKGASGGN
jgi:curli biogenesis system outer membrane secretion channel CsgG